MPGDPQTRSPSPTSKQSDRKSWFSFKPRRAKNDRGKNEGRNGSLPLPPPSAFDDNRVEEVDTRLGPLQFAPNRIATLYVTPSERNLYLAAMSELDQGPQPLPLWSDPAPTLPQLPLPPPIDSEVNIESLARAEARAPIPSKLVTSPGMPRSGLQVREEFRTSMGRPGTTRHALLCLTPDAALRFTGFPPETLVAVDRTLRENWPLGVRTRSEAPQDLARAKRTGDELTWSVELHGEAWRRKGGQELHSIRLLLALLTTLAVHGWRFVGSLKATGPRKESHNLLFQYDSQTATHPPVFFALSLPLPDRVSLISPPNKVTPALLTAVRDAICSSVPLITQKGVSPSNSTSSAAAGTHPQDESAKTDAVKLEGWVHPGVYRFWIAGLRRWLGGTVNSGKVSQLHPHLLPQIIDNLYKIDFRLVGSIPLLPLAKDRDLLFFSSAPTSELTYLDSFRAEKKPVNTSTRNGTRTTSILQAAPAKTAPAPNERERPDSGKGALPWTAILAEGPPEARTRRSRTSSRSSRNYTSPSGTARKSIDHRTSPHEVSRTATDSAGGARPKGRNVLTKKNSIAKRRSTSATRSADPRASSTASQSPGRSVEQSSVYSLSSRNDQFFEASSDEPVRGISNGETSDLRNAASQSEVTVPASVVGDTTPIVPTSQPLAGAKSSELPPIPPSALSPAPAGTARGVTEQGERDTHTAGQNHPNGDVQRPLSSVAIALTQVTPAKRVETSRADEASREAILSMHGSVGYFPIAQSVLSDGRSEVNVPSPVPTSKPGSARTRVAIGP